MGNQNACGPAARAAAAAGGSKMKRPLHCNQHLFNVRVPPPSVCRCLRCENVWNTMQVKKSLGVSGRKKHELLDNFSENRANTIRVTTRSQLKLVTERDHTAESEVRINAEAFWTDSRVSFSSVSQCDLPTLLFLWHLHSHLTPFHTHTKEGPPVYRRTGQRAANVSGRICSSSELLHRRQIKRWSKSRTLTQLENCPHVRGCFFLVLFFYMVCPKG